MIKDRAEQDAMFSPLHNNYLLLIILVVGLLRVFFNHFVFTDMHVQMLLGSVTSIIAMTRITEKQ